VLEGDGPATSAEGVSIERFERGTVSFKLESGTYHFLLPATAPES